MHYLTPESDRVAAAGVRTGALLLEGGMDDDEIEGLYQWAPGACFKCGRGEVLTTRLGQIDTPAGVRYDVRACLYCVLDLERERERHAKRAGLKYVPGLLGL